MRGKGKTTKTVGQMTKTIGDASWEGLFASGTLARLLTTFLTRPETAFYHILVSTEAARLAILDAGRTP